MDGWVVGIGWCVLLWVLNRHDHAGFFFLSKAKERRGERERRSILAFTEPKGNQRAFTTLINNWSLFQIYTSRKNSVSAPSAAGVRRSQASRRKDAKCARSMSKSSLDSAASFGPAA